MNRDPLIPMIAVVTDIRVDTPDVKTFRVVGLDGRKPSSPSPHPPPIWIFWNFPLKNAAASQSGSTPWSRGSR